MRLPPPEEFEDYFARIDLIQDKLIEVIEDIIRTNKILLKDFAALVWPEKSRDAAYLTWTNIRTPRADSGKKRELSWKEGMRAARVLNENLGTLIMMAETRVMSEELNQQNKGTYNKGQIF